MLNSQDVGCGSYGAGWLARWTLVDGWPRCVEAPLSIADAAPADLAVQVAVNRAVAGLLEKVEAVEAAQRLTADAPPDQWVAGADGDLVEAPAWADWRAAQAVIAGADADTLLLARTRAGTLAADEPGFVLALPPVPVMEDPCDQTCDLVEGTWVERRLTATQAETWPLRRCPSVGKLAFAQLLTAVLGDAKTHEILSTYGMTLSLAADIAFDDIFTDVNGGPAYADQLLAAGDVSTADIRALRRAWPIG